MISCNVRGMRDKIKRQQLFTHFRELKADVIFVQETHCTKKDQKIWRNEWGNQIIYSNGESNARGVAILFSKYLNYNVTRVSKDLIGRELYVDVKVSDQSVSLVNIYAPNEDNVHFFQSIIQNILSLENYQFVLGGDFNKCLNLEMDRNSMSNKYVPSNSATFINEILGEHDWLDIWRYLHPTDRTYTWFRRKNACFSRLDYFIIPSALVDYVEKCSILPGYLSDHSAIQLSFSFDTIPKGPGYWKLNTSHLRNIDFVNNINKIIDDEAGVFNEIDSDHCLNWDMLKSKIVQYAQRYSIEKAKQRNDYEMCLKNRVNTLTKKLHMINLNADNAIKLIEQTNTKLDQIRSELEKIQLYKTQGVLLRTKARWVEKGEKSSKYFFNLEKSKARGGIMNKCRLQDGSLITHPQTISIEQSKFYEKLYTKQQGVSFSLKNRTAPILNPTQKILLDSQYTTQELANSIHTMANNKSPGSDGLPAEFYKVFWSKLSEIMLKLLAASHTRGHFHESGRIGVISLIPKKDRDRTIIANWRPITLLNVDYKIFSKTIAARLKIVLPDLINEDQTGFMKNRLISENIRKVLDIINYTNQQKIPAILVSIDFEKAFDRCDYNALWKILQYFNFGSVYTSYVKLLFESFQLCTSNGGFLSTMFTPSRGLFQGNPIASFLFLLLIEILAIELRANKGIKGIKISQVEYLLAQFADDLNLFLQFDEIVWQNVMNVFDVFEECTGMRVSYDKTTIYRLGSLKDTDAKFYSRRKIQWTNQPVNILGIWVDNDHDKCMEKNFDSLIARVNSILEIWKMRDLSLMGKILILNTLIASLTVYKSTVLPAPSNGIFENLHKSFAKFIWNGKKAKIKLHTLMAPKKVGGLGLTNLQRRDWALKMQWVFHCISKFKIANLAYQNLGTTCLGHNTWQVQLREDNVKKLFVKNFWSEVLYAWTKVHFDTPRTCNEIISQIIWLNSNIRIKNEPILYKNLVSKGIMRIGDIIDGHREFQTFEQIHTKFGISNYLAYHNVVAAIPQRWKDLIKSEFNAEVKVETNVDDELIVKWFNNKLIVASAYFELDQEKIHVLKAVQKWNELLADDIQSPDFIQAVKMIYTTTNYVKLRSFQYRLLYHAIITNVHLYHYGIKDSKMCTFCGIEPEAVYHLFIECCEVKKLWAYICSLTGISELRPRNIFLGLGNGSTCKMLDSVILVTKHFIYQTKCLGERLTCMRLRTRLLEVHNIEEIIAQNAGKMPYHIAKWEDILNKL